MKSENKLWEVLVPKYSNAGLEYSLEHHNAWDERIMQLTGGMTILGIAKGKWKSLEGKLFVEEMISIRIYCTETDIEKILDHTLKHYDQKAIFAYEISSNVVIKYRES